MIGCELSNGLVGGLLLVDLIDWSVDWSVGSLGLVGLLLLVDVIG